MLSQPCHLPGVTGVQYLKKKKKGSKTTKRNPTDFPSQPSKLPLYLCTISLLTHWAGNHPPPERRRPCRTFSTSYFPTLQMGLTGNRTAGSLVSKLAHLRSSILFVIDLFHDTQGKRFIVEAAIALLARANPLTSLMPALPKEEEKYPNSPARAETASLQKPLGNSQSP